MLLNKLQEKRRVTNGKKAKIHDHSMEDKYHDLDEDNEVEGGPRLGDQAFLDLKNDEFVYIY